MVEVFRTNVRQTYFAYMVINEIHERFTDFEASFDLADCDKVLRIQSSKEVIDKELIIDLVAHLGFFAEVLPDTIPEPLEEKVEPQNNLIN